MLKKVKLKNIIAWNVFFLVIILLLMFLHIKRKEKYDFEYIASPEFAYYIENEAAVAEIKDIAISRSEALFFLQENNFRFYTIVFLYIFSNIVLLINEHINQRKREKKVEEAAGS